MRVGDHHWHRDRDDEIDRRALHVVRLRQQLAIERSPQTADDSKARHRRIQWLLECETKHRLDALIKLADSMHPLPNPGEGWDADRYLLAVPNGVVDLRTGKLRDGKPEDRKTFQIDGEGANGKPGSPFTSSASGSDMPKCR